MPYFVKFFFINKGEYPMKIKTALTKNLLYLLVAGVVSIIYGKMRRVLLNAFISSIEYIAYQPIGIKHNRILKTVFGKTYKFILDPNYCFDIIASLRLCSKIAFVVYSQVFKVIREIFELLNNSTYNPHMKRYDTIYLQIDQIVLSVILIAILLVIFINLIMFYCFFAAVYVAIEVILAGWELFEDLTGGNSVEIALKQLGRKYLTKMAYFKRGIFTGDLPSN